MFGEEDGSIKWFRVCISWKNTDTHTDNDNVVYTLFLEKCSVNGTP